MKIPKTFYKPALISMIIVLTLATTLVILLGFDCARKILGFISSIIGLPTAIIGLYTFSYILDENKLINRILIEAGKKDQKEWEEMKKKIKQADL